MKPSELNTAIRVSLETHTPIIIYSPPGSGKSKIVHDVAGGMGFEIYDVRGSTIDPVDLRGLPDLQNGKTTWRPPDFLPHGKNKKACLFLDELPNAPASVQSALLQLVLDRKLGNYELPEQCAIIGAGNRVQDRAGASRLSSSLAARFGKIELEVDLNDWCTWALDNEISPEIIAFIRFRPELLSVPDPRVDVSPNPRAWEFVSRIHSKLTPEIEMDMLAGFVGEGAAGELCAFLRICRDLQDPDAVLLDPLGADIPEDPAKLYALCGALAVRASEQNGERLIQYANRLPDEFNVLLVTDSIRRDKTVANNSEFSNWAIENNDVLT